MYYHSTSMSVRKLFTIMLLIFSVGKAMACTTCSSRRVIYSSSVASCPPTVNCKPTAHGGQGDVYHLKVVADIWLESSSFNYNSYKWLLVAKHRSYSKKRSLLRFQDIPSSCKSVNHAMMYIYYSYSFKPSWYSIKQAPFISRTIQAHRVLKSWNETTATSTRRGTSYYWTRWYLGLDDTDADRCPTGYTTIHAYRPSGFVEIEVTSAAQDWKAGKPNNGLVIWATNEDTNGRDTRFASRTDSDSSKHAFILINCN